MEVLKYIIGFLISIGLVVIGFVLTQYFEHGLSVSICTIAIPFIGWFFLKVKQKEIGMGMLISSIPIGLLALLFIFLSELH
jgi:heme/copper-type cytochrome/quinol oxidase subunit 4